MKLRTILCIFAAVFGVALLSHCAKMPVTESKTSVLMAKRPELRADKPLHDVVWQEYAALNGPELQTYVNDVGQRLARQSHRPGLQWHFTVVDSPEVNAFSLLTGDVYITRGLMAYLNSEAELASVLGHEIGHVVARHEPRQQAAADQAAKLGSLLVPELNSQTGAEMTQPWLANYGRGDELESNRLGAQYLAKAGYPPQALLDALDVLKSQALVDIGLTKKEGRESRSYHGATDPYPGKDARLRQLVGEAAKYAAAVPYQGHDDYLLKMAGVAFGDSPGQGVIHNNALIEKEAGFGMAFPLGWQVQHQTERVVAVSPENDALIELRTGPKNVQSMETLQSLKLDQGARFMGGDINGYPASFAAGALEQKPVLVGAVVFGGTQYLIAGLSKDVDAYNRHRASLKASINSFHALTPQEHLLARTHAIRIITAHAGTTMAGLASKSPLGSTAESQLRLINGLYPTGEPHSGQLLKVIQ